MVALQEEEHLDKCIMYILFNPLTNSFQLAAQHLFSVVMTILHNFRDRYQTWHLNSFQISATSYLCRKMFS